MKKILTIIAMLLTVVCGSALLVSCSNGYKKMYLVVEYALPTEEGKDVEWHQVEADSNFDYTLTDDVYSETDDAHILYLRVKVKGTSKKVKSLYISQSTNNATFLDSNTINPNEAFKVKVKNIGSVRFSVVPSEGGEDKAVSFGVNVYKQLDSISQNVNCVPAVVSGGYIELENLSNLIKYEPLAETNQTGVDFKITGLGTLVSDETDNLIGRTFAKNNDYTIEDTYVAEAGKSYTANTPDEFIEDGGKALIRLHQDQDKLKLELSARYNYEVEGGHRLTNTNNVIELEATSKFLKENATADERSKKTTKIYVYIVENFKANSLLVSYKPDITLTNGQLPSEDRGEIDKNITIYNSSIDDNQNYNNVEMYTYTNASIYSYETKPGMELSVFINGVEYDYNDVVNNAFGIQVSPITRDVLGESKLVGLKFEVNPNSTSQTNTYNVRLNLDFTAFDFSASDTAPSKVLNKEFVIKVENLASGFYINGKGYNDNLKDVEGVDASNYPTITAYNSSLPAKLYTTYSGDQIGMALNIQATPTNAINTKVLVGFYDDCTVKNGVVTTGKNFATMLQLYQTTGRSLVPNENGKFEIDFINKNRVIYLKFNEGVNLGDLKELCMVCEVQSTPNSFSGETINDIKYITYLSKISVVGSVDNIFVYKTPDANVNYSTLTDTYLANNEINVAYINFSSNAMDVDYSEINITSKNGNIKFSTKKDGAEWTTTLTADKLENNNDGDGFVSYKKLYFKTQKECTDSIIITSNNGEKEELSYQFVNVTKNVNSVTLDYEDTYIWTANSNGTKIVDNVGLKIEGVDDTDCDIELRYLALQAGRTAQFKAFSDDRNDKIKSMQAKSLLITSPEYLNIVNAEEESIYETAISTFSASAIKISNSGSYIFDLTANSVGFTSILLVKVEFYVNVDTTIQVQSKYFLYEVAVYTPAREIEVSTNQDSILYINDNYVDVAKVNFTLELNNATRSLIFSSTEVNNIVNYNYGGNKPSLYGISVKLDDNIKEPYFRVSGLNEIGEGQLIAQGIDFIDIGNKQFSIQALKDLAELGVETLTFNFTIYQFCAQKEITTITKVIYLGDYNKSKDIIFISGVEKYNNIYLSLLNGSDLREVEVYVSNDEDNVTYSDMGYIVEQYNSLTETYSTFNHNNLTINHNKDNNIFTINAQNEGGIYRLTLYAKDSFEDGEYKTSKQITITVSDGRSEDTAYLLRDLDDFESLKDKTSGNYYKLWQNIDISALGEKKYVDEGATKTWWNYDRVFAGHLDGSVTIVDPNTGNSISKVYSLNGLKITTSSFKNLTDDNCFGLFSSVTGTIKNINFDDVVIDITLDNENTANTISIGAITAINNGTIESCSVNIKSGNIKFENDAQSQTYNIGLVAGLNNNIITYLGQKTGSNYSRVIDCTNDAGKLLVEVAIDNSKVDANTNIYIGGVAGNNAIGATISAGYKDTASGSVKELISAVTNIEFKASYNNITGNNPKTFGNVDLGGIVGLNEGDIKNIALSGQLKANDKTNIGAVAGRNKGSIIEVANYGADIEGYCYNDTITDSENKYTGTLTYSGTGATQPQNIGGIVGYNETGNVDNVRVMFITFDGSDVVVSPSTSYILGVGNVGGIIGKATNTTLIRAYVENFITDEEARGINEGETNEEYQAYLKQLATKNCNIIGVSTYGTIASTTPNYANVAGLIADSTGSTATLCFVQANFDVQNATFYEFGNGLTSNYVYFIGNVVKDFANGELENHNGEVAGKSYIVNKIVYIKETIDGETAIYSLNTKVYEYGVSDIMLNTDILVDGYVIQWQQNTEDNVNEGKPYLVYFVDENTIYTLKIRPDEIIVNVDNEYFGATDETFKKGDEGIYLQYTEGGNTCATAIVYYREGEDNVHKLVSEYGEDGKIIAGKQGLIEKTIIPNIADGSYAVSIVTGSNIATLTDGGATITFTGVGKVELKFISILDRTKVDKVTIFVENQLHEDVFEISAGAGLVDLNKTNERFTTSVDTNSLINLQLKSNNGVSFDSGKTYMKYNYDLTNIKVNNTISWNNLWVCSECGKIVQSDSQPSTCDNGECEGSYSKLDIEKYFKITPKTSSAVNGYTLGHFEISAKELETDWAYITIPVYLSVYLNLEKYSVEGTSLNTLMIGEYELAQKTIYITIYNKASGLTVSSDAKAEAGEIVKVEANLLTGYVKNGQWAISTEVVGVNGNKLKFENEVDYDEIELTLTAINKNSQDLLSGFGGRIWDLFDLNNVLTYNCASNDKITYNIYLKLKPQYRYLDVEGYTEREWKFNLNIKSTRNTILSKNVEISFVPQELMSFRLENYSNLVARVGATNSDVEAEFISNQAESSLIIPGESGLIKIFADYDYSYFEDITISSSRQEIDGKQYFIRYQQMVYNKTKNVYESYAGITADGDTLALKKVSYSDGTYDGVIFVRTILEEIIGVRKTFTITVNANTYDLDGNIVPITRTKTLISQYRPGVYISVTDAKEDVHNEKRVYLVEQNSNVTKIIARVYGYEFNVQPIITIKGENGNSVAGVSVTQSGEVVQDDTGAYIITYNLAVTTTESFIVSMKMSLIDNGNTLTSKESELNFHPVPYILNKVYLEGEVNGGITIPVNTSHNIKLVWATKATTQSKIKDINNKLNEDVNILDLFYIKQSDDSEKYFKEYLNTTNTNFSIKQNDDLSYRIESLIQVNPFVVYFNLWYGYDLDNNEILLSAKETSQCNLVITYRFTLYLTLNTTEDAPIPIRDAQGLMSMSAGQNYILTEDITLDNWTPLNTAIASLDGNNKIINIRSFNLAIVADMNVGLFGTVSEDTILKNVVVNIGGLSNVGSSSQDEPYTTININNENITNVNIKFGFLAGINNGIIYNCEVLQLNRNISKTIELGVGNTYTLTFGGLVGINSGNIINSRVGTEYFERLNYGNGPTTTAKINCGTLYLKSKGSMSGFVGKNTNGAIISSSFVANTSIENISSGTTEVNRTAGFVATNEGRIAYSYVKGLESNILSTKSTTAGDVQCIIYSSGSGSVAGFVFHNNGEIHDCYSNTVCISESAGVAGFVYNTLQGKIYQCYSASTVKTLNKEALTTQQPFIGVGVDKGEAKLLLSSKDVLNCYYLDDGTVYDTSYNIKADMVIPKALALDSFANTDNLNNFSFIQDSNAEQQLNGIWTYSTAVDKNRSTYPLSSTALPELTSANTISRSLRILIDETEQLKTYRYADGYELGTKNNPYIIRSVEEYKNVFIEGAPSINDTTLLQYEEFDESDIGKRYRAGYIRFIDDIDFKTADGYINIDTRSKYILGAKNNTVFTLIDGNGMNISGVVINYSETEEGNLGLFSEVYNAVIKSLQINYAGEGVGSSTASYVGGLAGIAKNTHLLDLNLSGQVTLRAFNVVGGVVGRLTGGNSGLYNITSTLSVHAGNIGADSLYEGESTDLNKLSYAGGIAGIVDIAKSNNKANKNINKLTVNGSSVRANRAGGVIGYLGDNINAQRLTYVITNSSQVFGKEVAGGIIADNYANIVLSQANREVEAQYKIDKLFAEYIRDEEEKSLNSDTYGNLNTITGGGIVGGFIGVNYGGSVENSLTKANIGHNDVYGLAKTVGGFIGVSYGGDLKYVYNQNYIDLVYSINNEKTCVADVVGGLIGKAYDLNTKDGNDSRIGLDEVVVINWFDETQVKNIGEDGVQKEQVVKYVIGELGDNVKVCLNQENTTNPKVTYGVFNESVDDSSKYKGGKITNSTNSEDTSEMLVASHFSMKDLYYTSTGSDNSGSSTQLQMFNQLFATWPEDYWDKDYTKFTPNLKVDNSTDYIKIEKTEDIEKIKANPSKNFILMNDISVGKYSNGNYVLRIDFTGVLIGTVQHDDVTGTDYYPSFTNIIINANINNDSGAGFFKSTTGARISNVGFKYNELTLTGAGFKAVGGVSSIDTGSKFEKVSVGKNDAKTGNIKTVVGTVDSLGSIVGEGTQTKISGCGSDLNFDVTAGNKENTGSVNIGGLIGVLKGRDVDVEGNVYYEGLIDLSVYSGNIKVVGNKGINVGGLVGNASYTRITNSNVKSVNGTLTESVVLALSVEKQTSYVGGIIAYYDMCSIANCSAYVQFEDRATDSVATIGEEPTIEDTTYYIGGLVGQINNHNGQMDKDIDDCYSNLTYNINKTQNVHIGGIVGYKASTSSIIINRVLSEIDVDDAQDSSLIEKFTIGGIVATNRGINNKTEGVYDLTINDSMSIMNCDIRFNSSLIGGGLIGQTIGNYLIYNSTAMGLLAGNNDKTTTSTLTVLGGFVGLAGSETDNVINNEIISQEIKYSYSALTLSKANIYQGDVTDEVDKTKTYTHLVYTAPIVGYANEASRIVISNVLYSSDYNLAIEDSAKQPSKFETQPTNVTANILITQAGDTSATVKTNDDETKQYMIGDRWIWITGYLPLVQALETRLIEVGIFKYNASGKPVAINYSATETYNKGNGAPYYPIQISSEEYNFDIPTDDTIKYKYYNLLVDDESKLVAGSEKKLSGVLLGNNKVLCNDVVLFNEISKHSAVSNITFKLETISWASGTGGVATINNGTVFMCGVQYDNITLTGGFGGIVKQNNGVINYCYNMGNGNAEGEVAGLVYENTVNASIENSYFTGSFSGGKAGNGLTYLNKGYITNSYSAGQASNIVGDLKDEARYSNVVYDYYANYVKTAVYNQLLAKGIKGLSTRELQAVDNYDVTNSTVFTGMKVYSMTNLDKLTDDAFAGKGIRSTYNYGYPIHNIQQKVYYEEIKDIPIRVKPTGDGTFAVAGGKIRGKSVESELDTNDDGNNDTFDNFAYLINNLGVLYLINDIPNNTEDGVVGTLGKYFELEVDITMPEDANFGTYKEFGPNGDSYNLLSNWSGIGTSSKPFAGVFTTSVGKIEGVSPLTEGTEDEYILDTTLINEEELKLSGVYLTQNNSPKTISNLTGGALFNCVAKGAVIANVVLDNSRINTASLINFVMSKAEASEGTPLSVGGTNPTIYNIKIGDQGMSYYNGSSIAGLIGKVEEKTTLNIHTIEDKIVIKKATNNVAGVVNSNNGTINIYNSFEEFVFEESAGIVAGFVNNNAGTINFKDDPASITINAINETANIQAFSGFATTNSGKIYGNGTTINIEQVGSEDASTEPGTGGINYIAGLVGEMSNGLVGGFEIVFNSDAKYKAKIFGGVVSTLSGGQLGERQSSGTATASEGGDTETENPIKVNLGLVTAITFGGVVGEVANEFATGVSASISNVEIAPSSDVIAVNGSETGAYGLVIGQYGNKLQEIYYKLNKDIKFQVKNGANVGAIIGVASNGDFNFANEQDDVKVVTVSGRKNVGGFIGTYTGTDSLRMYGNTWTIQPTSAYAKIECDLDLQDNAGGNIILLEYENFGGIIGFWNSETTLSAMSCKTDTEGEATNNGTPEQDEENQGDIELINLNPVLSFSVSNDNKEYFTNVKDKSGYDGLIYNVGGVVGLSKANIKNARNLAQVGVGFESDENPHKSNNIIYGTEITSDDGKIVESEMLYSFMQFIAVGGIAGKVEGNNIMLENCLNEASVYGMYTVGGFVGLANNGLVVNGWLEGSNNTGTATFASADDKVKQIVGLSAVGGMIGRAENLSIMGADKTYTMIDVYGITNVGGVAGFIDGLASITEIKAKGKDVKIVGNYNVGGFVGYAGAINSTKSLTITNPDGSTSTSDTTTEIGLSELTVYGSIFDYIIQVESESEATVGYFLPTNIGGVVGYAKTADKINITSSIDVKTDEIFTLDGKINDFNEYTNICTVNMTTNAMPTVEEANLVRKDYYLDNNLMNYLNNYYQNKKVKYDAVDGGIGSFAGKLDTVGNLQNCVLGGDVTAHYGINVGGMVGYLVCSPKTDGLKLPTVAKDETLNVAGKVNVGGYIGRTVGFIEEKDYFTYYATIQNIAVQRYIETTKDGEAHKTMTGYNIGGVFGSVEGNIYNVSLKDAGIRVYNAESDTIKSSYVGTIAGRITGNMANCVVDSDLCDVVKATTNDGSKAVYFAGYKNTAETNYTPTGIITNPNVYNYGGLVGLVDSRSNTVSIKGEHYYAFTVELIQTDSYEQGKSEYLYKDDSNGDTLTANAHYINTANIEISATKLNYLYFDRSYLKPADLSTYPRVNPTNSKAQGWAKEYTMFRTLARVISQINEPTGDSIQIIYNANDITEVKTTHKDNISDEIIYTIYQPRGQDARLYCKYGIAVEDDNFVEQNSTYENDGKTIKHYFRLDIDQWEGLFSTDEFYSYEVSVEVEYNTDGTWKSRLPNNISETTYLPMDTDNEYPHHDFKYVYGRQAFWTNITNIEQLGTGIDLTDKGKIKGTEDEECAVQANKYNLTFGYSYFLPYNYLGKYNISDGLDANRTNLKFFKFEQVFGWVDNSQSQTDGGDTNLYSPSGSLFEVSGTATRPVAGEIKDKQAWIGKAAVGTLYALAVVGAVAALILSGGTAAPAIAGGFKTLMTVKGILSVSTMLLAGVAGGFAASDAINKFSQAVTIANYTSQVNFAGIENASFGYLSSAYARTINWEDNELLATSDDILSPTVDVTFIKGEQTGTATEYHKELAKAAGILDNEGNQKDLPIKGQLVLPYINITTSRNQPKDINATICIKVEDMEGEAQSMLQAYGIAEVIVPRYYQSENEIYAFTTEVEYERVLYGNYEVVNSTWGGSESIYKGLYENEDSYAYLFDSDTIDIDMAEKYLVSKNAKDHVKDNYRLDVTKTINKNVTIQINVPGLDTQSIEADNVYWDFGVTRLNVANYKSAMLKFNKANEQDIENELYVYTSAPNEPYVAKTLAPNNKVVHDNDTKTLTYVIENDSFGSINTFTYSHTVDIDVEENITLYFSPKENAGASYVTSKEGYNYIQKWLIPNLSGAGFSTESMTGYDYNDCLGTGLVVQLYTAEDKTVGGVFNEYPCKYRLVKSTVGMDYIPIQSGTFYEWVEISSEQIPYTSQTISVYSYDGGTLINSNAEGAAQYFGDKQSITLQALLDDLTGVTSYGYAKYSLSNYSVEPVGDNYKVENGVIYQRTTSAFYSVENDSGEVFIYESCYKNISADTNYSNRFVYDLGGVKLYTRFKYNSASSNFLEYKYEEGKTIQSLLGPKSNSGRSQNGVLFVESARISLSPTRKYQKDGRIYHDYDKDNPNDSDNYRSYGGYIYCDMGDGT